MLSATRDHAINRQTSPLKPPSCGGVKPLRGRRIRLRAARPKSLGSCGDYILDSSRVRGTAILWGRVCSGFDDASGCWNNFGRRTRRVWDRHQVRGNRRRRDQVQHQDQFEEVGESSPVPITRLRRTTIIQLRHAFTSPSACSPDRPAAVSLQTLDAASPAAARAFPSTARATSDGSAQRHRPPR